MTKHLVIAAAFVAAISPCTVNALSAITSCTESDWKMCLANYGVKYAASCSNMACGQCRNGLNGLVNSYGVITTTSYVYDVNCPTEYGGTATCECRQRGVSYKCGGGYYGTATSSSTGCTKCPDNATCAGGNGSTFSCAIGYYKNGSQCTQCPDGGTTSAAGATSISSCYIPLGTSFTEIPGNGLYTRNCPY